MGILNSGIEDIELGFWIMSFERRFRMNMPNDLGKNFNFNPIELSK